MINMSLAHDPYLRNFLSRYASDLKAMSSECRAVFKHFFKKTILDRKSKIVHEGSENLLNVFGDQSIRLNGTPDFSKLELTPLMLNVCRLLERQTRTFEQLVTEYGPSKRDEIVGLLRDLNHEGLLLFGEDEMALASNSSPIDRRSQSKTITSRTL